MSDYGRIKKDGTFKNVLVTAPNTYQKSDKEIITNFNEDETLMKEYGYKQVITTEPPYDENYETLTVDSLTQDDENIYLTYGVDRFANPPTGVDLSNYYTKQQVYNKKEIDSMLENLKNDSITTDDLYALSAEIENLKAGFAKIDMAEIDRLSTAYADIEELKSKLANIDTATIKNLTTEVGNIKLLLNGHLTSDNIESLVLTASKVTVEDAFIKDAMIDSINANKINTGVLNTNKVNIESEDGSMTLKGNLQQFKDKNGKVRIQIGKDATGDFTFSLFNAEGTGVLIDENGIKSGAIGSGLIVDDMVSDNAHISGGKIDIDSLITNINGNTSTINSSKIKFDDTNQTLDVAFTALKTKVDSIEKITVDGDLSSVIKQVQSNTTNIKLQQGQISSLIDNTTITSENGKTIQLKDAYNSTVSKVDSLVTKIGTLETNVSSSLTNTETQFYTSTSPTSLEGGEWITDKSPTWVTGKYIWQRMKYTYSNGGIKYSTPVCIQGAKGEQGDKGEQGASGKTTYFHIKYSANANGNPMTETPSVYIGTYVDYDPNDSTDYTAYTWSRFEGMQGEQGIPGTNGTNGLTYYLHIKYSDDGGKTFTSNKGETAGAYIGVYTDTNEKDSELVTKYTWSKIKGDQGLQGVPGKDGVDGKTHYTWIKYADDDKGNGISNEPTGKTYIGLAYNKTTQTESNTPSDYMWSLIKGDKGDTGVQGEKGKDGITYYTWIKYSDNADGTGLYDTPKDTTNYIGIAINKTTPTESSNKTDYVWSRFKGDKGDKGEKGDQGQQGNQGQQGEKGDTGQSMTSSTPQWYASTSATTQTGGSWLDTMPTLEVGKYYWIRYKQTWENPTKTTYTEPILEELGEAIKEVKSQQSNLEHTLEGFKQTVSKDYAKQTTVTDLTNKLAKDYTTTSDMNSIIDQKVEGVLTTVSKTYATSSSVTDLNTKLEKDYYTSTQVNSAINQKADGILSTVSDSYAEKTVVNDLANNLSSNYTTTTNMNSAIEQKANGILNTVSKTYTTKDELKELSFGGRNYLLDTKNAKTITGTKSANQCTNLYVLSDAKSSCNSEKMSLSFTYKVSSYTGGDFIIQTYGGSSKGWSRITPSSDGTFTYKHTITTPTNFDTATGVQIRMDAFVGTVEISDMMLEKGNTFSDWTPAPEDNASLIEDLGDYVLNITKETVIVSTDLSGNILS
jgi:hypothetical protein